MDKAREIPRKEYFQIAPAEYLKTALSPDVFFFAIPHTACRKEFSPDENIYSG
jgi:hypothetical protein